MLRKYLNKNHSFELITILEVTFARPNISIVIYISL